jgi:hypothetical protein
MEVKQMNNESNVQVLFLKNRDKILENYTGIVVRQNGVMEWRLNGKLHREDGPAVEFLNGAKYWYLNGVLHREDGPAVELSNGTKKWYLNGKLHNP